MPRSALRSLQIALFSAVLGYGSALFAQDPATSAAEAPPEEPAPAKPKPPPYSLPWQLRPVVAASVVRSDTAFAFYKDNAGKESGTTVASMLLGSYKVTDELAPMVRLGVLSNSPPSSLKTAAGADID